MKENGRRVELLAPASGFLAVRAAFEAGADAVYAGGGRFGARAYADNMDNEDLIRAMDYAHLHGKNLYLTVNTLLKDRELEEELFSYLRPLYERGLDAVIVQDLGVLSFVREHFPGLAIHASTQMTITGEYAPEVLHSMGVERIVTARELSLSEIRAIHERTPGVEIESFVHGALCVGYSGMCFFSSSLGERSGNRGRCAQSCRLNYQLLDESGREMPQMKEKGYCLSPKDLCALSLLPDVIEAGVYSLKIEGRMKRPEYAAGVTAIYRKYLDRYLEHGRQGYEVSREDVDRLADLYNRGGFTDGYYRRHNGPEMMSSERPNHHGTYVGTVSMDRGRLFLTPEKDLNGGDVLELRDGEEFTLKDGAKRGKRICLPFTPRNGVSYQGKELYRMKNQALLEELGDRYLKEHGRIPVEGMLTAAVGSPLSLSLWVGDTWITVTGEPVAPARNQQATEESLRKSVCKTGGTEFELTHLEILLEGAGFVPVKALNELRRRALEDLTRALLEPHLRESLKPASRESFRPSEGGRGAPVERSGSRASLWVQVSTKEQAEALLSRRDVAGCYVDLNAFAFRTGNLDKEREEYQALSWAMEGVGIAWCPSLPMILRKDDSDWIRAQAEWLFASAKGVLLHGVEQLWFLRKLKEEGRMGDVPLVADYMVYQMNGRSMDFLAREGVKVGTLPIELTRVELEALLSDCPLESELVFYGFLPVLFTAQCQKKNGGRCDGRASDVYLRDRRGKKLRVRCQCESCYNVIYNSQTYSLFGLEREVASLPIQRVRLSFTEESVDRMHEILDGFGRTFPEGEGRGPELPSFTRGHFRKGVE